MSDSYSKKELELLFLPLVLQESILSRQSGPVIVSRDYGGVKNKVSITLSGGVHKGKRGSGFARQYGAVCSRAPTFSHAAGRGLQEYRRTGSGRHGP